MAASSRKARTPRSNAADGLYARLAALQFERPCGLSVWPEPQRLIRRITNWRHRFTACLSHSFVPESASFGGRKIHAMIIRLSLPALGAFSLWRRHAALPRQSQRGCRSAGRPCPADRPSPAGVSTPPHRQVGQARRRFLRLRQRQVGSDRGHPAAVSIQRRRAGASSCGGAATCAQIVEEMAAGNPPAGSIEQRIVTPTAHSSTSTRLMRPAWLRPSPSSTASRQRATARISRICSGSPAMPSPISAFVRSTARTRTPTPSTRLSAASGLPDRDYYLVDSEKNLGIRAKYKDYLAFLLGKAGLRRFRRQPRSESIISRRSSREIGWDRALARNPELTDQSRYPSADTGDVGRISRSASRCSRPEAQQRA